MAVDVIAPAPPTTTDTTPWLNFGCGNNILRGEENDRAYHQFLIPQDVFAVGRKWVNADIVPNEGVDELVSMTRYPFPWPDNHFGGVVLSHVVEHIPHEIVINPPAGHWLPAEVATGYAERVENLKRMQDGWYAFWSELYRVCKPDAVAHVIAPYWASTAAITDPTHYRLISEHTFTHCLAPQEEGATFYYVQDCHWELTAPPGFHVNEPFMHLIGKPDLFQQALMTQINVAHTIYGALRAVK